LVFSLPTVIILSVRGPAPPPAPPLGAHILTPRWCYSHHGIYVGRGRVVHYGGLSRALRRGPIEEVSLDQFAQGKPVFVRAQPGPVDREEVVRRARSRLGENRYHVLANNCEHFCEWCMRGQHRSYQVEDLVARYGRARRLLGVLGVTVRGAA